jgi:hypothetical protein
VRTVAFLHTRQKPPKAPPRYSPLCLVCFVGLFAAPPIDAQQPTSLVVIDSVHHTDIQNREPMLAQLPNGSLFVTGFPRLPHEPARAPSLWVSRSGGRDWTRVDVGSPSEGATGNSDVDLAVGPDGTLYFVTMGFDRSRGVGTHIAVGVSHDQGSTWTWTRLSNVPYVDRPWIEVAPDGTAHVIWNDGTGVFHVVSTDRGHTWPAKPKVHERGGSSHLAIGPHGELAVRITPLSASGNRFDDGIDSLAISTDTGDSWHMVDAPGTRAWSATPGAGPVPRWVEPLAWDETGSLYSLWSEGPDVYLGQSRDRGTTWRRWRIANGEGNAFYPYLAAGSGGRLAASWFSLSDRLVVTVALISFDNPNGDPTVIVSEPIVPSSWLETDGGLRGDTAGEYVPVAFLGDGDLGLVTPLQDPRADRFGFTWWRLAPR